MGEVTRPAQLAMIALAAMALGPGCRSRGPSYDRKTPEAAVASFFDALNRGRMPRDLGQFILEPDELDKWKFTCRHQGCKGGHFRIASSRSTTVRAVLTLDYEVTGEQGGWVMRGTGTEVELVREGKAWMFRRFGKPIVGRPQSRVHAAGNAASADDADAAGADDNDADDADDAGADDNAADDAGAAAGAGNGD